MGAIGFIGKVTRDQTALGVQGADIEPSVPQGALQAVPALPHGVLSVGGRLDE